MPYTNFISILPIASPDAPYLYYNINISRDSFPQNEPSVKISRKNSNYVVAAWRDFRTGVDPPLRRIGYSYSTDGGVNWAASQLLPSFSSVYPLASDPAVCVDTAGNFYISTISVNISRLDGTVVIYKSTNQGVTFDYSINLTPHPDTLGYHFEDKDYITCDLVPGSLYRNNLYVAWGGYDGSVLMRSTNGGLNWSNRIYVASIWGGAGLVPAVGPGGVVYVVWAGSGDTSGLYGEYINKSTDGGLHFGIPARISLLMNGGNTPHFPSIAVDISGGVRNGYVYVVWSNEFGSSGEDDVYFGVSSDGAATWSSPRKINNDPLGNGKRHYWPWISISQTGNISIIFYDSRNTPSNSIIEAYLARSTNGGLTFSNEVLSTQQFPTNYPNWDVRFGDYIGIDSWYNRIVPVWTDERAGGYNQEIYTAIVIDSTVGIQPIAEKIPVKFSLSQNYPNPFNPSTKIRFEIPLNKGGGFSRGLFIRLSIYDLLGREVSTLVNEQLHPGTYEVEWDGTNYPSGVYFYKLTAGNYSDTKKLVILK